MLFPCIEGKSPKKLGEGGNILAEVTLCQVGEGEGAGGIFIKTFN